MFIKAVLLLSLAISTFANSCEKSTIFGKVSQIRTGEQNVEIVGPGCTIPLGIVKDVTKLDVKDYTIPKIQTGAIRQLEYLTILNFEENNIEELEPGAFQGLEKTFNLSLAKNKIRRLPERVFQNVGVKYLHFEHNLIESIAPKAFDFLPQLDTINLNHNRINKWHLFDFIGTPQVSSIFLSNNLLTEVPENAFKNFASEGKELKGVHLGNNLLESVHPKAFEGFDHLIILHLENNKLRSIRFDGNLKIGFLHLSNNSLTCLDDNFIKKIDSFLNIDRNKFTCDCVKMIEIWKDQERASVEFKETSEQCVIRLG